MLSRLLAISLASLLLVSAAPLASAAPPAGGLPSSATRWVDASLDLAQPDLTTIVVNGESLIYRYTVNGKLYDADDIADAYAGINRYQGEATGSLFVESVEDEATAALRDTLLSAFPGASVTGVSATVDRSSFVNNSGGSRYLPAVVVILSARVERSSEDVGLGTLGNDAVAAAFAAGARYTADFTLTSESGYDTTYDLAVPQLPPGLAFADNSAGVLSADARTLTLNLDNTGGRVPSRALRVTLFDREATPPTSEDIRTTVELTLGEVGADSAAFPIAASIQSEIKALDLGERFEGALPEKVSLSYVSADGLRGLRQTGAISDDDLAEANEGLLGTVQRDLAPILGSGITVTGGISSEDLLEPLAVRPYDDEPPVAFVADASGAFAPAGVDASDVDLALAIGGLAKVDLALFAANGRATDFVIHAPPNAAFTAIEGGTVSSDGATARVTIAPGATPVEVAVRGRDAPTYTAQDAELAITVDLKDLDVSLGEAAGGDFGDLLMDVKVTGNLGVIELPDSVRDALPAGLELEYISSDGIRLLVARGKLSQENLTKLEDSLLDTMAEKLGAALGGAIPVAGGFDDATLSASLVSEPLSGDKPIVFSASASVRKPVNGGPVQPAGAIALYSTSLPLSLPKVQGLDTAYTVILPRGLSVTDLKATGGEFERGTAPDGREQFTVRPSGEQADVTVAMAVTPTFVLAKFWPVVLFAVLLLVLIVGSPIAFVVMRRRGKGKKQG